MLDYDEIERAATRLLDGAWPEDGGLRQIDLEAAYRIQDEAFCQRLERGERAAGVTARVLPGESGDPVVVTSWLTDALLGSVPVSGTPGSTQHWQVGAEFAFVVGRRISVPVPTPAAALAAVDRVHAAMHIRYSTGADNDPAWVAATNGATAAVRLGRVSADVTQLELELEACVAEVDAQVVDTGIGAACLGGDPVTALAATMNSFLARRHVIEPGWVILTGPIAPPVVVGPGETVGVRFTRLGALVFRNPAQRSG